MKARRTHSVLTCFISIGAVIGILILACLLFFAFAHKQNADRLYTIANTLGYQDASFIAQESHCWDLWSCGMFLYYTTDRPQADFARSVNALNFQGITAPISSSFLFTEINRHTNRKITIDGDDLAHSIPNTAKGPTVTYWILRTKDGKDITIEFYELHHEKAVYAIDGQIIHSNIVIIMIRTN